MKIKIERTNGTGGYWYYAVYESHKGEDTILMGGFSPENALQDLSDLVQRCKDSLP